MYYLCSENKGADLRLCFRIYANSLFSYDYCKDNKDGTYARGYTSRNDSGHSYHMSHSSTRAIWKVRSMVFFLSNRLTNSSMFGIILNSHLSSMSGHKFHDNVVMQTRIYCCEYVYCLCTVNEIHNVYFVVSVQDVTNIL